jgi:hypothetical protein
MQMRALGKTGLSIAPSVFGGNVFGWTVDEKTSINILDAFFDAGFNALSILEGCTKSTSLKLSHEASILSPGRARLSAWCQLPRSCLLALRLASKANCLKNAA